MLFKAAFNIILMDFCVYFILLKLFNNLLPYKQRNSELHNIIRFIHDFNLSTSQFDLMKSRL